MNHTTFRALLVTGSMVVLIGCGAQSKNSRSPAEIPRNAIKPAEQTAPGGMLEPADSARQERPAAAPTIRSRPGPAGARSGPGADPAEPDTTAAPDSTGYTYVTELPEALVRVPYVYPPQAREAGIDGTVLLEALVGVEGNVRDVRVVRSIPMLDEAAKAAVRQWKFKPALLEGKRVTIWVGVPVKFSRH